MKDTGRCHLEGHEGLPHEALRPTRFGGAKEGLRLQWWRSSAMAWGGHFVKHRRARTADGVEFWGPVPPLAQSMGWRPLRPVGCGQGDVSMGQHRMIHGPWLPGGCGTRQVPRWPESPTVPGPRGGLTQAEGPRQTLDTGVPSPADGAQHGWCPSSWEGTVMPCPCAHSSTACEGSRPHRPPCAGTSLPRATSRASATRPSCSSSPSPTLATRWTISGMNRIQTLSHSI